ncbi:MAG: hypothetical protein HQL70_06470 [Magnetococcales bacterium]|nr:hypothetical protein [Magnetococcales bacterium]
MSDKSPFRTLDQDQDVGGVDSVSSSTHLRGIEAFRKVANSLAAQQQRALDAKFAAVAEPHDISRRQKSQTEPVGAASHSNPFITPATGEINMQETTNSVYNSNVPTKHIEREAHKSSTTIRRKNATAEAADLVAVFSGVNTSSNTTTSKAEAPVATATATATASTQSAINTTIAASDNDLYRTIPVESLAGGIFSLLGDAVGGIVGAAQTVGGKVGGKKSKKRAASKSGITVNAGYRSSSCMSTSMLMSSTVSGGVKNIFFGAGQIVKGGAGIVIGSLGCIGGALVCMTGTLDETQPVYRKEN